MPKQRFKLPKRFHALQVRIPVEVYSLIHEKHYKETISYNRIVNEALKEYFGIE